ncbi:MAG: alpha/beta fold hydrolase [Myxococcota bacterium]
MRAWGWLLLGAASCTTIQIGEQDAFDVKQTVDADFFQTRGATREKLRIPGADPKVSLDAWYVRKPDSRGTVLLYGGNGYLMVTAHAQLDALLKLPVDVLTFDYRGYGRSTGSPSVAALEADALAVYDHLVQELAIDPDQLILHGHSLGSFVAMFVEEERSAAAVVLENPVSNVDDLVGGLVPWLFDPFVRFEVDEELKRNDNLARAERTRSPLLVFSGTEDPIAPDRMAKAIHERAVGSEWVSIEGGGHNDLPRHPPFVERYQALLNRAL